MQDLKGHLYPFCRDQHGSRLVQQQLESADAALVAGARASCANSPVVAHENGVGRFA